MADTAAQRPSEPGMLRLVAWLLLMVILCVAVPGCSGCWSDPIEQAKKKKIDDEAKKKKKLEKPKEPFEAGDLVIDPVDSAKSNYVKPGHWITATQVFKANDADLPGAEFQSAAVDVLGRPLEMDHVPFRLHLTRPASLGKGQAKHFEFLYYVPRRFEGQSAQTRLQNKLYARGGTRELFSPGDYSVLRMPAHQYHLIVLATDPDRYGYLKRLESINPIQDDLNEVPSVYYRVSLPRLEKRVPLPSHPLAWTSIAYIFWDGIDPNLLTPDQQDGLLDWLHWGGQLIVSGPESLDLLRSSFLADYLPAEKNVSVELEQSAFDAWNEYWSLPDRKQQKRTLDVVAGKPPIGVELKLTERGSFVPHCGELLAESRVGRGRIAVTAYSMTSRTIINWGSLDNYFNNAVLRRPKRVFSLNEYMFPEVKWVDYHRTDPRLVTTLRYFSRDIGYVTQTAPVTSTPPSTGAFDVINDSTPPPSVIHPDTADWHFDGYSYDAENQSGVAGWNDFCAAADAARDALREAAGISIPKSDFVLRVLAVYLLVLVPVNWGFFRLLGRVEWAWIAAPLIAIVGAVAVVRLAQLDIGFARSQTEVGILEVHAGHKRGHLTRYTALYSSLSTSYDIQFDDANALAQPFPTQPRRQEMLFQRQSPTSCYFTRRDQGVSLQGFLVRSNTTGFVHSEQLLKLGGSLQLVGSENQGWAVENQSNLTIRDAALFRRVGRDMLVASIGTLRPKTVVSIRFEAAAGQDFYPAEWKESPVMSPAAAGEGVSLHRLVSLATRQLRLDDGETRLLGWCEETLPGMNVVPSSPQTTARTLVLVHLAEPKLPEPESDHNIRLAVVDEDEKDDESEEPKPEAGAE